MVKRILLVDDEEDWALSIRGTIEDLGFECSIVPDGESALLKLHHSNFDLVLLDILMPSMSGIDVLKKIRSFSKLKDQKVAFLSILQLSLESKNNLYRLKPLEYFQKPITDIGEFKKKLKKLVS